MACDFGELHAICFLWTHVFYVLIMPFLRLITIQQHQSFYRQQITLTGMMGIGRIANTKRVTFSEEGCMSIELAWVLVRVLVWVSFSSFIHIIRL